jgi:hypothetical protein
VAAHDPHRFLFRLLLPLRIHRSHADRNCWTTCQVASVPVRRSLQGSGTISVGACAQAGVRKQLGRAPDGASNRTATESTSRFSRTFAAAAKAIAFAKAAYRKYWLEGCATSDAAVAADAAASVGCDRKAVFAGMQQGETKDRLIFENDEAIRRGVFGSPFFFVDGEPFWGSDRISLLVS